MDIPAVVYDRKTQIIYHENSDGTRVEIGKRMRKGRYSERVAKEALTGINKMEPKNLN